MELISAFVLLIWVLFWFFLGLFCSGIVFIYVAVPLSIIAACKFARRKLWRTT